MAKKELKRKLDAESLLQRLDDLETKVAQDVERETRFEAWEEKTGRIIEAKVFEIKAIAYITLIIVAVLLALNLGSLARSLGL